MTSYNPACPAPSDIPRDSQDEFLMNFTTLNSLYSTDHLPFTNNNILTNGMHTQIHFEKNLNPPNELPNRSSWFSNTPNGAIDSFYQNTSSPSNLDNLTNNILTLDRGRTGFTTPWGPIINQTYSTGVSLTTTANTPIPFPIPFSSKVFFVNVTLALSSVGSILCILVNSVSLTQFTIRLDPTFNSAAPPVLATINYFCMGI